MELLNPNLLKQLSCYSLLWWSVFVMIAATLIWLGGFLGMVAGWIVIAAIIVVLDLLWISGEMSRPGWDGVPDQDIIFMIGVLIRVFLVNVCLLPISISSSIIRRRFLSAESLSNIMPPESGGPECQVSDNIHPALPND